MANAFLVVFPRWRYKEYTRAGCVGQRLRVLFGGLHQSAPSFKTFGVVPGDCVYSVSVRTGVMHIVGRLDIDEIMPVRQYLAKRFGMPEDDGFPWWDTVDRLAAMKPKLLPLLPRGCITEAAVGKGRTTIRFDCAVPGEALERLRLTSRTGPERRLRDLEAGRLKSVQTLLGRLYRLTDQSAEEFAQLYARLDPTATSSLKPDPHRGQSPRFALEYGGQGRPTVR
jgi:hypothetical protein